MAVLLNVDVIYSFCADHCQYIVRRFEIFTVMLELVNVLSYCDKFTLLWYLTRRLILMDYFYFSVVFSGL